MDGNRKKQDVKLTEQDDINNIKSTAGTAEFEAKAFTVSKNIRLESELNSGHEESMDSECAEFIDDEEHVELDDVSPANKTVNFAARSAPSTQSLPALSLVKYAPFIEPRVIKGNLYGIAIDWANQNPKGNIRYMTQSVHDTYKKISSGSADFRVVARVVRVKYDASKKNLGKAEQQSIAEVLRADGGKPKGPNDYFLIVNGCTHGSHTSISRHICHLANTLITTANHENGHSLGLLHSNVLVPGKPKEGSSLDGTSFMSIYSSGYLTASQTYYMGWLNQKVAVYDFPEKISYRIHKFDAPLKDGELKSVILTQVGVTDDQIINPVDSPKPLFLSYPKFKDGNHLALHTTYGGKNLGSTRHKVFGDRMEYQGFLIEKTAEDDSSITVQISRSPTSTLSKL